MDWQNAIFAPGWVWSMLSLVLVVGSLVGLYRQLLSQHTQMLEGRKPTRIRPLLGGQQVVLRRTLPLLRAPGVHQGARAVTERLEGEGSLQPIDDNGARLERSL